MIVKDEIRKLRSRLIEVTNQIDAIKNEEPRTDYRTRVGKARAKRLETLQARQKELSERIDSLSGNKPNVVESEPAELLPFEPDTPDAPDENEGDE